jgi:hypothetical protein
MEAKKTSSLKSYHSDQKSLVKPTKPAGKAKAVRQVWRRMRITLKQKRADHSRASKSSPSFLLVS